MGANPVEAVPATPVASVQPAQKKGMSKGLIIGLIILVLLLCCCGIGVVVSGGMLNGLQSAVNDANRVATSTASISRSLDDLKSLTRDSASLGTIESADYTFYYPKAFQEVKMANIALQFTSKNTNGNGGNNSINLVADPKQSGATLKSTNCSELAKSLVDTYSNQFGVKSPDIKIPVSESFETRDMYGCDVRYEVDFGGGSTSMLEQMYYAKNGKTGLYVVSVFYTNAAGDSSEAQLLRTAVTNFNIK